MKKLILLFAAIMMANTTMWAETKNVSYRYPVYNTKDDPASGIKEWKTSECTAIILTTSSDQVTLSEPWYVITGTDDVKCYKGIVIQGNVNLILADGAKLTVTGDVNNAGIQVSGEGYSLTIYGQDNQSGQLITTGTSYAAGIGGGTKGNGSNITINGGAITATGDNYAAGIGGGNNGDGSNIIINGGKVTANGGNCAAGIGGGANGNGSNIIINGGKVTANGGTIRAAGIGGGEFGNSSNIFIAKDCIIKADNNNPPTTVITNTGGDLASSLVGKRYVNIEIDLNVLKDKAIDEINKAIDGVTDADILAIATTAITDINNATTEDDINSIKTFALTKINAIAAILSARQGIKNTEINNWTDAAIKEIKIGSQDATPSIDDIKNQILYIINLFQNGKTEGIADANAALPSDAQNAAGHTVTITKGEKTLKLVNPDKVTFGKQE
ncbi:MAG: hypothetical protein MJZ08_00265 [Bacteroidaceae bacterium]|nr:hypothetical protein [Bacteroidaceae bacterium]